MQKFSDCKRFEVDPEKYTNINHPNWKNQRTIADKFSNLVKVLGKFIKETDLTQNWGHEQPLNQTAISMHLNIQTLN